MLDGDPLLLEYTCDGDLQAHGTHHIVMKHDTSPALKLHVQ